MSEQPPNSAGQVEDPSLVPPAPEVDPESVLVLDQEPVDRGAES